ncbi:hypothetical protein CYMTET_25984 [Cymbomonas tetramitiformis]|uniref:Uncharacterized protein n=1 Tax=Cymbomonas tetramitiformis TaxID=36881 RepID=A0AAE0KYI3_9CHLO|nr:hypothetical protein CYMTET_25984 [Cymbomonas tetramitiformis]
MDMFFGKLFSCFVPSTRLHTAASDGDLSALKEALAADSDVPLNAGDWNGYTALHLAAKTGNTDIVDALLAAGINLEAKSGSSSNPARGTALHMAAKNGQVAVVTMLLEAGSNKDAVEKYNRTPLGWAMMSDHEDIVKVLVSAGANLNNLTGKSNRPPLSIAINLSKPQIARILLDAGANTEKKCGVGLTDIAEHLLKSGVNTENADKNGRTALLHAIFFGHLQTAEALMKGGANKDAQGKPPPSCPILRPDKAAFPLLEFQPSSPAAQVTLVPNLWRQASTHKQTPLRCTSQAVDPRHSRDQAAAAPPEQAAIIYSPGFCLAVAEPHFPLWMGLWL